MRRKFHSTIVLLLGTVLLSTLWTAAVAHADPDREVIEMRIHTPTSGRTQITLRTGPFRRSVSVGASPTPADLEPLFNGLPEGRHRAMIVAESEVPYATVITVMDALRRHRIDEFALSPP